MAYAFLTYRVVSPSLPAAIRRLARSLVVLALLLASATAAEARYYYRFGDVLLFGHPADAQTWQTDGTPEGTRPFELFGERCFPWGEISGPVRDGTLFLCPVGGLWFFDATTGQTVPLTGSKKTGSRLTWSEESAGSNESGSYFTWWEEGQRLLFLVTTSGINWLWSSDLTTSGTRQIAQIPSAFQGAIATADAVWWLTREQTQDQAGFLHNRYELWRTDGTRDGTFPTGIVLGTDGQYSMSPLMPLADSWVVALQDQLQQQLWSIDVSTEKAVLLAERPLHRHERDLEHPYVSNGRHVFFEFDDDTLGELHLWVTDGTVAGTRPLTDLAKDVLFGPTFLTAEDLVFFAADDGVHGWELWVTDGTDRGTHLFADLCPGECSSYPVVTTLRSGGPYFIVAEDVDGVRKPWWSDGTLPGTRLMTNSCAGQCLPHHPDFPDRAHADPVAVGDRVFFNALDLVHGEELWVSDAGGPARRVTDFAPRQPFTVGRSRLEGRAEVGGRLVFDAFDHVHGVEPWVSDGTAAGTHLLVDLLSDDNAAGPPAPPPGKPEITVGNVSEYDEQSFLYVRILAAEGPVDHFVLESRGPDHDWRYVGAADPFESSGIWHGQVYAPSTPGVPTTLRAKAVVRDGRASAYSELLSLTVPIPSEDTARCTSGPQTLCLDDGRFRVRVAWRNQHSEVDGQADHGQAGAVPIPGSVRSGHFWFFRPDNVELVVKILDGSTVNGFHWTFYGALTDVEYWITVDDTAWGTSRTYYNPPGRICGVGDTASLPHDGPQGPSPPAQTAAAPAGSGSRLAAGSATPFRPASRGLSFAAVPGTARAPLHPPEPCTPDAETLCLLDGRSRVRVEWTDQHNGGSGVGVAMPYSDRTGFFSFFNPQNVELAVKVLDGTPVNGKIWVLYGALSDIGYTITVEDLAEGHAVQRYVNPPGNLCGRADTAAF